MAQPSYLPQKGLPLFLLQGGFRQALPCGSGPARLGTKHMRARPPRPPSQRQPGCPKTVTPPHSPAASSLSDTACYSACYQEGRGLCWVRGLLGQCWGTARAQDTRRCGVYLMKWRGLSARLLTSCAVLPQVPNLSDPRFLHPEYRTPLLAIEGPSTVTRGTVPTQ